jgi:galactose mutarotase-like enzyme
MMSMKHDHAVTSGIYYLENEWCRVGIKAQGAEWCHFFDKTNQIELLWQGDAAVWSGQSPNLFPKVGRSVGDVDYFDGQAYPLPKHGFARHSLFELHEKTTNQLVLRLMDTSQTHLMYPYAFCFDVVIRLVGITVDICYRIHNRGDKPMPFQVGGHPAFNVPMRLGESYEDYALIFPDDEQLISEAVNLQTGLLLKTNKKIALQDHALGLHGHLFDEDALVLKQLHGRMVSLVSTKGGHGLRMRWDDFPFLGIWAKPHSPFVCLEPWVGCADPYDFKGHFHEKTGVATVQVHQTIQYAYQVQILGVEAPFA